LFQVCSHNQCSSASRWQRRTSLYSVLFRCVQIRFRIGCVCRISNLVLEIKLGPLAWPSGGNLRPTKSWSCAPTLSAAVDEGLFRVQSQDVAEQFHVIWLFQCNLNWLLHFYLDTISSEVRLHSFCIGRLTVGNSQFCYQIHYVHLLLLCVCVTCHSSRHA